MLTVWKGIALSTEELSVAELIATVERLSGGPLRAEEGFVTGDPECRFDRALVCWMATTDALLAAEKAGIKAVIPHETLYFQRSPDSTTEAPGEPQINWPANRRRVEIIERAGLTVVRFHGSVDRICVFDEFAAVLGLPERASHDSFGVVFDMPPTRLRDLIPRVKEAVGLKGVRVACTDAGLDQIVQRVGLPWGGVGLWSNMGYSASLIEQGCDVLIAGETDAGSFYFAIESGVPLIETSHEASEIPGIARFAKTLGKEFPHISFEHYDNGTAWRCM